MTSLISRQGQHNKSTDNKPTNNKVFAALLAVVFIMPWPHGGEVVWQYLLFSTCIFSLAAIYFINNTNKKGNTFSALKSIKIPLTLLGMWLLFQVFQIIPLPIDLNKNNWQTISIAPNVTLIELIKHTSYITIFILTLLLLNTKQRILILAKTLFISSAIITFYSLIDFYSAGSISIIEPFPPWDFYSHDTIHGTFSYKNHFASFLLLTIPLGFGLVFINLSTLQKKGGALKTLNFFLSWNGLISVLTILMSITLVLNSSRAGNAALLVSFMCTMAYIVLIKRKKISWKKFILSTITTLLLFFVIFISGISDNLISRYENDSDNGREQLRNTAISILKDHPITGSGAGTFPVIHQQYKSSELNSSIMWQRVHNDYLEMLGNQGIVGFTLLGSSILLLFMKLFRRFNTKNSPLFALQLACIISTLAILIHSIVDFNFQLPVNAVYFYLILAIGIKIPSLKMKK